MPLQRRKGRKTSLTFEQGKVFEIVREDLNLDLEKEAARYRARKGQAGNRHPIGLFPRTDYESFFV